MVLIYVPYMVMSLSVLRMYVLLRTAVEYRIYITMTLLLQYSIYLKEI